jgi:hypothetical protein
MWRTSVFQKEKVCIFAQSKKGQIEIQPEVYPISKPLSGPESPRRDSDLNLQILFRQMSVNNPF